MSTPQTFDEVVAAYADYVYNIIYRMLGNPHDAEEAAQEAFISAYRNWDRFRGDAQVTTWLYRIAVNAALMRIRKDKRGKELTHTGYEDRDVPDWAHGPERSALNSELRQAVETGLQLIPEDLRAPVVLRDVQELSNTEAADVLGITVTALKARLHRGRVLLRKHLEQYLHS